MELPHKMQKMESDLDKEIATMDAILEQKDYTTESILENYHESTKKSLKSQEMGWNTFFKGLANELDEYLAHLPS